MFKNYGKLEIIDSAVVEDDNTTVHGKIKSTTYSTLYNDMDAELTINTGCVETTYATGYAIRNLGNTTINGGTVKGISYGVYNKTKRHALEEVLNNGIDCTSEVLGNIQNARDNYYFVEEDGKYVPNNTGVHNSTANSYFEIDLREKPEGTFAVNVTVVL